MAVDGGNGNGVTQAQVIKLVDVRALALVHLVHRQHHRLAAPLEHGGNLLVGGGHAGLDVAQEHNDRGVVNGDLGLRAQVEFARDVIGYNDAHSAELDPNTTHPVIHIMPEQIGIEDIGGTLRLGAYPCVLDKTSKAYEMYGTDQISERHRHRYEVNNDYREALTSHGMKLSGLSPDGRIVEMIEIPEHPWFIATQAHPELKSRPNRPHPLFRGFIEASLKYQEEHK